MWRFRASSTTGSFSSRAKSVTFSQQVWNNYLPNKNYPTKNMENYKNLSTYDYIINEKSTDL